MRFLIDPDGRLSVARIHLLLGVVYLLYFLFAMLVDRVGSPFWVGLKSVSFFLIAMIVLAAGAAALPLETHLTKMPARVRAWLGSTSRRSGLGSSLANTAAARDKSTSDIRSREKYEARRNVVFWSLAGERGIPELAVIQLVIGIVVIPLVIAFAAFDQFGWRMVAVSAISEIVYLAFLCARIVKVGELAELVQEISRLGLSRRRLMLETPSVDAQEMPAPHDVPIDRTRLAEQIERIDHTQRALEARAGRLWQELGFIFDFQSDVPAKSSRVARRAKDQGGTTDR